MCLCAVSRTCDFIPGPVPRLEQRYSPQDNFAGLSWLAVEHDVGCSTMQASRYKYS